MANTIIIIIILQLKKIQPIKLNQFSHMSMVALLHPLTGEPALSTVPGGTTHGLMGPLPLITVDLTRSQQLIQIKPIKFSLLGI